jgi:hypothetical protein
LEPVARVTMSLRASLYGLLARATYRLTMNLATHQRAQRRDRTNVYMSHWITSFSCCGLITRRVPPTEAARPKPIPENRPDCGPREDFKGDDSRLQ